MLDRLIGGRLPCCIMRMGAFRFLFSILFLFGCAHPRGKVDANPVTSVSGTDFHVHVHTPEFEGDDMEYNA